MQTYTMYKSHIKSVRDLDNARLDKQRLECLQILQTLREESDKYQNHLAMRMWDGFEPALVLYGLIVCHEWRIVRGMSDKVWMDLAEYAEEYGITGSITEYTPGGSTKCTATGEAPEAPPWLTDVEVLRSHRSNLKRKLPARYGDMYPETPDDMPFLWPQIVHTDPRGYRLRLSTADQDRLDSGERILPDWLVWDPNKMEVLHS
jgi:hypothetical protein